MYASFIPRDLLFLPGSVVGIAYSQPSSAVGDVDFTLPDDEWALWCKIWLVLSFSGTGVSGEYELLELFYFGLSLWLFFSDLELNDLFTVGASFPFSGYAFSSVHKVLWK